MRYKPEHKQETHQRIVTSASKAFRTRGFDGIGIAKLMGILNLTHGGFYAHFAGKDELISEACGQVLDQTLDVLLAEFAAGGMPAVIDFYLSEEHRNHPENGCVLPTLSAEIARHSPALRETFTKKVSKVFNAFTDAMPGKTPEQKRASVYALFSTLVGAVSLARTVSDPSVSSAILESARQQSLRLVSTNEA